MPRTENALVIGAIAALVSSCSSSESSPATPADAGPTGTDFTVYAVEQADPYIDAPFTGIAGVSAFVDTASGTRIEATSEADGKIVFHGVDFSAGPISVTGYASGRIMQTVVGVTPEVVAKAGLPSPSFPAGGSNLLLFMLPAQPPAPADTIKLSGTIAGKQDAANMVTWSCTASREIFQSSDPSFALNVNKGAPLHVTALEWKGGPSGKSWNETKLRWLRAELPANDADATTTLDLASATPLTPTPRSVTLVAAPGATLSASPGWQVNATGPFAAFFGSRNTVTPDADGVTFAAPGEIVDPPSSDITVFTFAYFPGINGETAYVRYTGVPDDGARYEMLPFPSVLTGAGIGADVTIPAVDPKTSAVLIDVVDHSVSAAGQGNDVEAWQIGTVRNAPVPTSIHVPDLPDAAKALLPASPSARLAAIEGQMDSGAHAIFGARVSLSKFFKFSR